MADRVDIYSIIAILYQPRISGHFQALVLFTALIKVLVAVYFSIQYTIAVLAWCLLGACMPKWCAVESRSVLISAC